MDNLSLIGGFGSLLLGLLFVLFPRPIGVWFCRLGKSIWKGHEKDAFGKVRQEFGRIIPFFSNEMYDETKAPRIFRFMGVVFLFQAGIFFVLSAVL